MISKFLFLLACTSLFQQSVLSQRQSTATCDGLDSLIANRNRDRVRNCRRNDRCNGIVCEATLAFSTARIELDISSLCNTPVANVLLNATRQLPFGGRTKPTIIKGSTTSSLALLEDPLGTSVIGVQIEPTKSSSINLEMLLFPNDETRIELFQKTEIPFLCAAESSKSMSKKIMAILKKYLYNLQ